MSSIRYFIFLPLLLLSWSVAGFWPFGDVQSVAVDDVAVRLTIQTFQLSQSRSYQRNSQTNTSLASAEMLASDDIIQLLSRSSDKSATLQAYMTNVSATYDRLTELQTTLGTSIIDHRDQMTSCAASKVDADQQFFLGLNSENQTAMQAWLQASITHGKCYIENRIQYRAMTAMQSQMTRTIDKLSNKLRIIESNKDLILTNFPLFADRYLEQLIQVRDGLNLTSVEM